jgi:transketolase
MTMPTNTPPSETDLGTVADLAAQLRVDSIRSSTAAGSGHPTSSMSAADLLAVLVTRHLHYDWDTPHSPANDHPVFSKGHASPLLYSVFKAVGVVAEAELLDGYRRFGQRLQGHPTPLPTELGWDLDAYATRAEAFGARALVIDGHDLPAIDQALAAAADATGDRPTVILARTVKGKGFSEVEDRNGWHGKPFPQDMAERAIAELGGVRNLVVRGPRPAPAPATDGMPAPAPTGAAPRYVVGDKVATRQAYGDALVALGARDPQVVALDGEVSNSTYAEEFAHAYPDRYFEMFIAEQQMVAAATGLSVRGYRAFASTFAAFWTRAHDFIHMGAISGVDLRLVGSHAGVEIGADGPSQMGLEDLAMLRAIHGSTVLYPSDATSTAALVDAMAATPGISYLRAAGRSNLAVAHLAVREMPGSGSGAELLAWAGLDADHIAAAARRLIGTH